MPGAVATGMSPAAVVRADVLARRRRGDAHGRRSFRLDGPRRRLGARERVATTPATRTATLDPDAPLALADRPTRRRSTGDVRGRRRRAAGPSRRGASPRRSSAAAGAGRDRLHARPPTPPGCSNGTAVQRELRPRRSTRRPSTAQNFTLTPDGGAPVAATRRLRRGGAPRDLTPLAPLAVGARYTARLTHRASAPRPARRWPRTSSWSFTTADCPCSLMSSLTPAQTGLPVHDYRPGPGPVLVRARHEGHGRPSPPSWSRCASTRSRGETGTHVGRVWICDGRSSSPRRPSRTRAPRAGSARRSRRRSRSSRARLHAVGRPQRLLLEDRGRARAAARERPAAQRGAARTACFSRGRRAVPGDLVAVEQLLRRRRGAAARRARSGSRRSARSTPLERRHGRGATGRA